MISKNREKHKALRALHVAREKYLIAVYTAEVFHQAAVCRAEFEINEFGYKSESEIHHAQARDAKESLFNEMVMAHDQCKALGISLLSGSEDW
jgi:hypothetical protein